MNTEYYIKKNKKKVVNFNIYNTIKKTKLNIYCLFN